MLIQRLTLTQRAFFDPRSNARTPTKDRIAVARNESQIENADGPISRRWESPSNVTFCIYWHPDKQFSLRRQLFRETKTADIGLFSMASGETDPTSTTSPS
jgi:hypothetical protein